LIESTRRTRLITAGRILLSDGTSINDAGVVVTNGRIERVAPLELLGSEQYDEIESFPSGCLTPGLIDAHVHLCFDYGEGFNVDPEKVVDSELMSRVVAHCRGLLGAGVTSVCDLGSIGDVVQRVRTAIDRRELQGPRIHCAGRPITTPDGHLRSFGLLASDEASMVAAVATLVGDGVDVVKVVATGGAGTPGTALGLAQFTAEELSSVVRAAAQAGLLVAAHVHGTQGIVRAVAAGVHTLQHCSWMDTDGAVGSPDLGLLDEMIQRQQVAVVAGPLPQEVVESLRAVGRSSRDDPTTFGDSTRRLVTIWANARSASEHGVVHALGTDALFGQFEDYHDLAWRAQGLVELGGWSETSVLEAIWSGGSAAMGLVGQIGVVAPGARADLVVLGGDPRIDIRVLHDVRAVYFNGQRTN
jgi:imidazolonepropionase-like amidohydrolase